MADNRLQLKLGARDETQAAFRTLKSSLATTNTAFANLTKVAAGLGVVFGAVFIRDLVEVNKKFQSLKASLVTFTGSVENADGAFQILKDFAKTTPFSLQEVVGSFNILVAQGIKPTEAQLGSFADIAGGTSKSIMQFAEAVADASVGEFERLKEFGIKAGKEGDQITLRMGDITKVVDNDAEAIVQALSEISEVAFAGGAARQAATLGGAITNLRDNVDEFMFAVGEAGLGDALVKAIKSLSTFISGNEALAKTISDNLTNALYAAVIGIRFIVDNLQTLLTALGVVFGIKIIRKVITTGKAMLTFGKAVINAMYATKVFSSLMGGGFTKNLGKVGKGMIGVTGMGILLTGSLQDLIEMMGENVDITELLGGVYKTLGLDSESLEAKFNELTKEIGVTDSAIISNTSTLSDFIPTLGDTSDATGTLSGSTADLTSAFDNVNKRLNPFETALASLGAEKAVLQKLFDSGKISADEYKDTINTLSREALGLDTTMSDLAVQTEIAEKAFDSGGISGEEYAAIISDIKSQIIDYNAENEKTFGAGAIKGVKDYYEAISDNASNMADFVTGSFGSLETTLSDFFQTGELDFGTFTDAIKKGLADLAAKAVITTGLNFLGDVFPSLSFADGGMVPGSGGPRADDVLARVSSGEYVVNAASVNKFGKGFFDAVNAGKMPGGGMGISKDIMESITPGFFLGGLIKDITGIDIDIIGGIGDIIGDIADAIGDVIGVVTDAIRGMVEGIMSGDMATIAALALPFVLPGIGSAVFANLGAGQGFAAAVGNGMSSSFASGVLGSGASLSSIATSVGIEFAKDSFTDMLSSSLSDMILGVTGGMGRNKGSFSTNRADSFANLYSEASPYLAGMTGANVHAGDSVRVGERGEEMFIPQRDGTIAPIKGNASDLIGAVNEMKDEIVTLRRQMSRMMAGSQLAGVRS